MRAADCACHCAATSEACSVTITCLPRYQRLLHLAASVSEAMPPSGGVVSLGSTNMTRSSSGGIGAGSQVLKASAAFLLSCTRRAATIRRPCKPGSYEWGNNLTAQPNATQQCLRVQRTQLAGYWVPLLSASRKHRWDRGNGGGYLSRQGLQAGEQHTAEHEGPIAVGNSDRVKCSQRLSESCIKARGCEHLPGTAVSSLFRLLPAAASHMSAAAGCPWMFPNRFTIMLNTRCNRPGCATYCTDLSATEPQRAAPQQRAAGHEQILLRKYRTRRCFA